MFKRIIKSLAIYKIDPINPCRRIYFPNFRSLSHQSLHKLIINLSVGLKTDHHAFAHSSASVADLPSVAFVHFYSCDIHLLLPWFIESIFLLHCQLLFENIHHSINIRIDNIIASYYLTHHLVVNHSFVHFVIEELHLLKHFGIVHLRHLSSWSYYQKCEPSAHYFSLSSLGRTLIPF